MRRRVERASFRRGAWLEWFVVELALETGLRVSEMAGLACRDLMIGFEQPGVLVRRGKGGKPRFVKVRSEFCRKAEDFLTWKQAVGEPAEDVSPVFFSSKTGGNLTTRAIQKVFERACRRSGVEGHSIHHCRHTYATALLKASRGNLRVVQKQLGHARITTTQIYADVFDEDMAVAVDRLYAPRGQRSRS